MWMIGGDVTPDSVTFLAIAQQCGECGNMELGKQVHQLVIKHGYSSDDFVGTVLVDMYGKCGCLESAYKVFEKMYVKDIASWNAMLSVYKNYNVCDRGFCLFQAMRKGGVEENIVTLCTMLFMCAHCGELEKAKQLHAYIMKRGMERDFTIEHALLSMYSGCDSMASALTIFNEMDNPDADTWNTFIEGLIHNRITCQAFGHFRHMQQSGTVPNSFTMVSLLEGCKGANLNIGRSIHGYIIKKGFDFNSLLRTALTDMYMDSGYEPSALCLLWPFLCLIK